MDSTMFMGLFIGAVLALLTGAGIIAKIIVSPVIKLREEITELRGGLGNMKEWKESVDDRFEKQDQINTKQDERITQLTLDLTECKATKRNALPAGSRKRVS